MDCFLIYLIVVNVLTFLFFTIDFLYHWHTGNDGLIHPNVLNLFGVAGGGLGMLAAFLVWDRKVVKDNVAWRFISIICVAVWGMIVAVVYGFIDIDIQSLMKQLNMDIVIPLEVYLLIINTVTFILFVVDKIKAIRRSYRIREYVLLMACFLGGEIGGLLAMIVANHKIRTWYFLFGLPFLFLVHGAVFLYCHAAGIV